MIISRPVINSASIAPNPTSANTTYVISVSVSEVSVEIEPLIIFCGTLNAGEEGEIF